MNNPLRKGSLRIATVAGIPIWAHFSWLIIFGLITWSLSSHYFPRAAPDLPVLAYWIKGVLAALLLFGSVVVHELSHSLVARKFGLGIESITLFIFGGVARMKEDPRHPSAEFWIAIAGPLSSFVLSFLFFVLALNTAGGARTLFIYLAQINLILGIFNLIPGFPMDGGRVLRSAIWRLKGDYFTATLRASSVGQTIALVIIFFGFLSIFRGGPGGLWLMLIGWFLYSAAQASYRQATLQEILAGVTVEEIMATDLKTVSPGMSLDQAVNEYFLKYGYGGFPVVEAGDFLGMVTLKEVKNVPKPDWGRLTIADVYVPHDQKWEVTRGDDVLRALELMIKEDKGRVAVKDKGRFVGLITRNGIARYVQIKGK